MIPELRASNLVKSTVLWLESILDGLIAQLLRPAQGAVRDDGWMMAFLPADVPCCGESLPSKETGVTEPSRTDGAWDGKGQMRS